MVPNRPVQRLSESLANQIAAGEVVERPASAVKELVENSLDAGAKRISVQLEDGGRQRLEVTDDGRGMSRDDALLSLERHTTSKLATSADLFDIRTFGFRGEALPSIASVSRFTLTTRRSEEVAATRIVVEGGKIKAIEEAGAPAGTRVEVADLFWNVPARLKFLKARATELGHVSEWLSRLALANPAVSFALADAGRVHLKADATTDLRERIAAVLGRELFDALYPVEGGAGDVRLTGFAAGPQRANQNAREIFTFVNGRFVRDRGLMHAVSRAYEGVLQIGRSPAVVLFLEVPAGKVDVNVHPQKLEVRFQEPRTVYDAVARTLATMLATSPWLASTRPPPRVYPLKPVEDQAVTVPPPLALAPSEPAPFTPRQQRIFESLRSWVPTPPADEPSRPVFAADVVRPVPEAPPPPRPPGSLALRFSELRFLGQVHRTYLVCEAPEGLVMLDQHAAHERVLYERFKRERAGVAKHGQPLLVPVTLEFSPSDARVVDAAREELQELGFELEPFGGTTFALKSCPPELEGTDLGRTVRELAAEVRDHGRGTSADALEEALLARMSCHTAVRKGDAMSPSEVAVLLEQLDGTPFHAQCPHGRPVVVRFDVEKLEEMFARTYEGTSRASARDKAGR